MIREGAGQMLSCGDEMGGVSVHQEGSDLTVRVEAEAKAVFDLARQKILSRADILTVDTSGLSFNAKSLTTGELRVSINFEVQVQPIDENQSNVLVRVLPYTGLAVKRGYADATRETLLGYLQSDLRVMKLDPKAVTYADEVQKSPSLSGRAFARAQTLGAGITTIAIAIIAIIVGNLLKSHYLFQAAVCNSGLAQLAGSNVSHQCLGPQLLYDFGELAFFLGWIGLVAAILMLVGAYLSGSFMKSSSTGSIAGNPPNNASTVATPAQNSVVAMATSSQQASRDTTPSKDSGEVKTDRRETDSMDTAMQGEQSRAQEDQTTCPGCGNATISTEKFCSSCGERLYGSPIAQPMTTSNERFLVDDSEEGVTRRRVAGD
jgi:hypothetical protein